MLYNVYYSVIWWILYDIFTLTLEAIDHVYVTCLVSET